MFPDTGLGALLHLEMGLIVWMWTRSSGGLSNRNAMHGTGDSSYKAHASMHDGCRGQRGTSYNC